MATTYTSPARTHWFEAMGLSSLTAVTLNAQIEAWDDEAAALRSEAITIEATLPGLRAAETAAREAWKTKEGQRNQAWNLAFNSGNGYNAAQFALAQGYAAELPALLAAWQAATAAVAAAVGSIEQKRNAAQKVQSNASIARGANPA
jgi:hypothetical protein